MKKNEITIGSHYIANVSGNRATVRVDAVRDRDMGGRRQTVYDVTNLRTGHHTTFRSAQRFLTRAYLSDEDRPIPQPPPAKKSLADKLTAVASGTEAPHVVVVARAGTGKTTTLVEGLKVMRGLPVSITPSPQQAAVWEALQQSSAKCSVCFVAFNKSIATELQNRVPEGCAAMTMHSLGFRAVQNAFGRVRVESYRVQDIISELLERDIRELRKTKYEILQVTEKLVALCKQNLASTDTAELEELAAYYDVDLNGDAEEVFDLVRRVLVRCRDVARDGCVDFNDMIWLPVALDLTVQRYDLLLVDEAQDLNRCQQALALKAGRRIVLCGDDRQAIYGFAGADAESLDRMQHVLGATPRGCTVLPLTVTRRCARRIVAEAQALVPEFEAHETNPHGDVHHFQLAGYTKHVHTGDMILCRVNAPLVSECFRFIKEGRKANIQGRDVAQGLISTVTKLKARDVVDLQTRLEAWLQGEVRREQAKRNPSEARVIALQDRYDCLCCFMEGAMTVEDVVSKIESIFTDDKQAAGIRLSSIHKAKGLEAQTVFFLEPKGATCPHPMAKTAWQRGQEMNLRYVAITRAISTLVYVS